MSEFLRRTLRRITVPWDVLAAELEIRYLAPLEQLIREQGQAEGVPETVLAQHWSLSSVLAGNLDPETIVAPVNKLAMTLHAPIDPIVDWDVLSQGRGLGILVSATLRDVAEVVLGQQLLLSEIVDCDVAKIIGCCYRDLDKGPLVLDLTDWDEAR